MSRRVAPIAVAAAVLCAGMAACGATNGNWAAVPASSAATTATTYAQHLGEPNVSKSASTTSTSTTSSTTVATTTTTTTMLVPAVPLVSANLAGVTISVPAGWAETGPGSTGGDFVEYLFTSRQDPAEQLLVQASACAGCIQSGPPTGLAPQGAINVIEQHPYQAAFQLTGTAAAASATFTSSATTLPTDDSTDGVVKTALGTAVANTAYAVVAITLPTADHGTATAILNSVKLG